MAEDDSELERFVTFGQTPIAWQSVARDLICAGNVLRAHWLQSQSKPLDLDRIHTSYTPALLLYGFAMESLVKGLLVAQGVDATSSGRLNRELKSHDLLQLFRRANLGLDPQEAFLLRQLKAIIENGRYPVGLTPGPSDPMDPSGWADLPCDVERIGMLLERVEDAIRALLPSKSLSRMPLLSLGVRREEG